jgi:ADP-heptose:LPS heptosyltransferase
MKVKIRRTLKAKLFESLSSTFANTICPGKNLTDEPKSIFVLRNNDLGDVLCVTPFLESLKTRFPHAKIGVGVGAWAHDILVGNPNVDEIITIDAPWHNKVLKKQTNTAKITYLLTSPQVRELREKKYDLGIDVLGSYWGTLLMSEAGIPYRMGVKGYAGGFKGVQSYIEYDDHIHVARFALHFAEKFGVKELPSIRPQIYLTPQEIEKGDHLWEEVEPNGKKLRIVIAPGGGFSEKCWPLSSYVGLAGKIVNNIQANIVVIGGRGDIAEGLKIEQVGPGITSKCGKLDLRGTFSLLSKADLVICNSSMVMHAAVAFKKQCVVLLGEIYINTLPHLVQWGYGDETLMIGRELPLQPFVATVDKAYAAVLKQLKLS